MLVRLARKAFLGDMLYEVRPYGVEVPERFRDQLPSGAVILDEPPKIVEPKKTKPVALSALSKKVAGGDVVLDEED